ncbi:protein Wnt-4 isoform X9 [Lepeophtheirus salmonis]|uniref:protein Wnt-4 isoform X9 n=2 Tax=Lepeophtheirus salmonis TaxID=72036 RepID=UPI001AE28211|nr:protein Wnt-4-like isoform X4 [Lepeophtheirus salmonis]
MKLFVVLFILLPYTSNGIQWLALSRFSSIATINPLAMCEKMKGSLIRKQVKIKFCKKNPNFMDSVRLGAVRAVDECQHQFQSRRWNCSTLEDILKQNFQFIEKELGSHNTKNQKELIVNRNKTIFDIDFVTHVNQRIYRSKRQGNNILIREGNGTSAITENNNSAIEDTFFTIANSGKDYKTSLQFLREKSVKNKQWHLKNNLKTTKSVLTPYPVVSPGTREMAFVHAISSAGVAHALTRACSSGELENCGCDRSLRGMSPKGFQWSGCSDNVDFGITFSRTFVDARDRRRSRKKPQRAQPLMNLHNNEAGRKLLERNMKIQCKCHGVSGSCELKTCWRSIASFRIIGEILKEKFDNAHEVTQKKRRGRRMLLPRYQKFKPHTDTDLVYLKNSPDYCDFDMQRGSLGTHGRECNPNSDNVNGCNIMCCNRGFITRKEKRVERCKCKFHWCCYVECEECFREVQVSTCN